MNPTRALFLVFPLLLLIQASVGWAAIQQDKIFPVDSKKRQSYLSDGLFVGGDQGISEVVVKDVRRAANSGFERVVVDLEAIREGEKSSVQRAPYFHVAITPEENRIVLTLWGKPKLAFDAQKVLATFKKSSAISKVELYPPIDGETWTLVLNLKSPQAIEVFELPNPVRIITDIRPKKGE